MKALHAIPSDKKNRWSEYIQVKNGFVYSANHTEFVKIPAVEVFGKGIIKDDEELYFDKNLWATSCIQDANKIRREGNVFTALLKGVTIGFIMPCGSVGENSGELIVGNNVVKFVDFDGRIAQGTPVLRVGINEGSVSRVGQALGAENIEIQRVSDDFKFPHILRDFSNEANTGLGFSGGLEGLVYEYSESHDTLKTGEATGQELFTMEDVDASVAEAVKEKDEKIEKLDESVSDLNEVVEELEKQVDGLEEVELTCGKLTFKTDNLQMQEIMTSFVELLRSSANPRDLLETLAMMA